MPKQQKKGAGNKKHGRNLVKCARYKSMMRREHNKRKRILKYIRFVIKKMKKHGRILSKKAFDVITLDEHGKKYAPMLKEVME
jgi:hypothetical protein